MRSLGSRDDCAARLVAALLGLRCARARAVLAGAKGCHRRLPLIKFKCILLRATLGRTGAAVRGGIRGREGGDRRCGQAATDEIMAERRSISLSWFWAALGALRVSLMMVQRQRERQDT